METECNVVAEAHPGRSRGHSHTFTLKVKSDSEGNLDHASKDEYADEHVPEKLDRPLGRQNPTQNHVALRFKGLDEVVSVPVVLVRTHDVELLHRVGIALVFFRGNLDLDKAVRARQRVGQQNAVPKPRPIGGPRVPVRKSYRARFK